MSHVHRATSSLRGRHSYTGGRVWMGSRGTVIKTMAKQYTHAIGPWREFLPVVDAP
jgi:hypothetical protein